MPAAVNRQQPPNRPSANGATKAAPTPKPQVNGFSGDILASGVPVGNIKNMYVSMALYGRNRCGKTTLACQAKKPLALLSIDPSPTGGVMSVTGIEGVVQYHIAGRRLPVINTSTGEVVIDPATKQPLLEDLWGSQKALAICDALKSRFDNGQRPFETIVIDGITSWNDIILQEVLGISTDQMKAILEFGSVSQDTYRERAERVICNLRPFFAMPCNIIIIAQEKDHNPPKDDKGRVKGSKLIRPAQQESFFSLSISDTPCEWIQNACDLTAQLYMDAESKEDVQVILGPDGAPMSEERTTIFTGKFVRRLRCSYHPNYAGGFRSRDYKVVPEYIEGGSPADMWGELMKIVSGQRSTKGKYND